MNSDRTGELCLFVSCLDSRAIASRHNTMSSENVPFPELAILTYLDLPATYSPSPSSDPITFLRSHLHQIPPHLQHHFSAITDPKQRTLVPNIRNRRLKYTQSAPCEL